jgi:UDP-glucuronate 4-epimerase
MRELFAGEQFDAVVHLAAQAGVRYSIENPQAYIDANVTGFLNVLEECRLNLVHHLVYASSSSVYGGNRKLPFSTEDTADHPLSLYAATKKANELMAHTYSHLYGLPTTGVRFFTVYGPWGRPDMAPFRFAKAILSGQPIQIYNYGRARRDFTYIDDAVESLLRLLDRSPVVSPTSDMFETGTPAPYRIYNIGSHHPVNLMRFIEAMESTLGIHAEKQYLPPQPGDVDETFADISTLIEATGFRPGTTLQEGLRSFVDWYREYYEDHESIAHSNEATS